VAAETETLKFKIGEQEYEIPLLDDFTMDEWQILYDYSGLVLEDFSPEIDCAEENIEQATAEDEAAKGETDDERAKRLELREKTLRAKDGPLEKARRRRIKSPAFTTARLAIGYRRTHPDATAEEIREIVGGVVRISYLEAAFDTVLASVEKDDAQDPPASTPELEQPSPSVTGRRSEEGSGGSLESSGGQVVRLGTTGTDG